MNTIIDNLNAPTTGDALRLAVRIFVAHAYGPDSQAHLDRFIMPEDSSPVQWLMSAVAERTPAEAPADDVRSFAMRIGNRDYPHMKLRLSRPPQRRIYLFSVDCHDAFLQAPAGSPDHQELEELKRHNAEMAATIGTAWEDASLPTEHSYLRDMIDSARNRAQTAGEDSSKHED